MIVVYYVFMLGIFGTYLYVKTHKMCSFIDDWTKSTLHTVNEFLLVKHSEQS